MCDNKKFFNVTEKNTAMQLKKQFIIIFLKHYHLR